MKTQWHSALFCLSLGSCLFGSSAAVARERAAERTVVDAPSAVKGTPASGDAQALFGEAQRLLAEGQTSAACDKFEQSLQARAGVGTKFNLADCWERLGKTASAHALFTEVAGLTRAAGQLERAAAAGARADSLNKVLSRLSLDLAQLEGKPELTLDGKVIPDEALSAPIALDPGEHEVSGYPDAARRDAGEAQWTLKVNIPAGPVLVVVVAPKPEPEAVAPVPSEARPEPARTLEPMPVASERPSDPRRDEARGPSGARRALTYGMLGVGAIGMAVSATMGKQFYDSNDAAKGICPTSRNCTREEIDQHADAVNDARNARNWAWVGGGVGGAALITAGILWLTEEDTESEHARLEPMFTTDGAVGALVQGRF
jgi:hypothetical protein